MANIFVDVNSPSGTEDGTAVNPWKDLASAIINANFFPDTETINIFVQDGTYTGNIVVDRGLMNFVASNSGNAIIAASSGTIIDIVGNSFSAGNNVDFDGFVVDGAGGASVGVRVDSAAMLGSVTLENMEINNTAQTGVAVNDVPGLDSITIDNVDFMDAGSGVGNSNGSGSIVLFDYHGDATLSNITIDNSDTAMTSGADMSDNAIQISGFDQATYDVVDPIGNVSFSNVTVEGYYQKTAIAIQGFTNLSTLSFTNVTIDAVSGWQIHVFIDPIASPGDAAPGTPGYPGNFGGTVGTNTIDLSGINIVTATLGDFDVFVRGTDGEDIYTGTNGRDYLGAGAELAMSLYGTDLGGDDTLSGGAGDDILQGGAGNDIIDGGDDYDIAIFDGNRADYDIVENMDGSYTVTNTVSGDVNTVNNVEGLSFFDNGAVVFDLGFEGPDFSAAYLRVDESFEDDNALDTFSTEDNGWSGDIEIIDSSMMATSTMGLTAPDGSNYGIFTQTDADGGLTGPFHVWADIARTSMVASRQV